MTEKGTATITELVDNLEQAGWTVGDVGTRYRVTNPAGGAPVFVPKRLPKNAQMNQIMKSLLSAGYDPAVAEAAREASRQERLANDRKVADKLAQVAAAQRASAPSPAVFKEAAAKRRTPPAPDGLPVPPLPMPRTEVLDINPDFAEALLRANRFYDQGIDHAGKCNRRFRPNKAAEYAEAMLRGEWTLGDSIKFEVGDMLIDGQHRLMAVVIAGQTKPDIIVPFLVTYDMPPGADVNLDQGMRRSIPDMLQMRGEGNTLHLAAAIRLVYQYQQLQSGDPFNIDVWRRRAFSRDQSFKVLDENPGLRDALEDAGIIAKVVTRSAGTAAIYLIKQVWPAEQVDEFLSRLASGADLSAGSPILALRETYAHIKLHSRGAKRVAGPEDLALFITAWNLYVKGKPRAARFRWDPAVDGMPMVATPK